MTFSIAPHASISLPLDIWDTRSVRGLSAMDIVPHQKGASKFGIMSIAIDANSRAPLHSSNPLSNSPRSDITSSDDISSFSVVSDDLTTTTVCSEAEKQVPLMGYCSRSNNSSPNVNQGHKIWNRSPRSKIHKLSTDFRTRVSKIRQHIVTETHEARETHHLLRTCRKSPLARKVRKGSEGKLRLTQSASRKPSSAPQCARALHSPPVLTQHPSASGTAQEPSPGSTPQDSRKPSLTIRSIFSDISSRKSSTTTITLSSIPPS